MTDNPVHSSLFLTLAAFFLRLIQELAPVQQVILLVMTNNSNQMLSITLLNGTSTIALINASLSLPSRHTK